MSFISDKFESSIELSSDYFLNRIHYGKLKVMFPSGKVKTYLGKEPGYYAEININTFVFLKKIFKKGSVGFAESYINGDFSSKNLTDLLMLAFENENHFLFNLKTNWFYLSYSKIKHYFKENSKLQSKKNIKYHYDLGNEFYRKWLDESMTYSSAFFENENEKLAIAQQNKYKIIAENLSVNENSNILEIGCGWGSFSSFIAKSYGCKVEAITISKEQFDFASKKIFKEGLNDKVKIQFKDYRDINEKYSKIASIEMFEAVGKKYWQKYFEIIKNSLSNNGAAALQIITIDEERAKYYQNNPDFIQQYIFPGGMLPSKKQIKNITNQIGLKSYILKSFGKSYAKTLSLWNKQFQLSWDELNKMGYNSKFKRMWEYYLSYCETGFISQSTDVSHFLIRK